MGFVFEVEAEGFAVEDIRPRHEEGCACKVFGDGIKLGQREQFSKALLCGWDRLACLAFGNDAETVTAWSNSHKVDFSLRVKGGHYPA